MLLQNSEFRNKHNQFICGLHMILKNCQSNGSNNLRKLQLLSSYESNCKKKKMSQHDPKMFDFSPGMQMFRQFWCNPKKFDQNTTDKHDNDHSPREQKLDKKIVCVCK